MPGRSIAGRPYPDDDGLADPRVTAALDSFASGHSGEHAAVAALAASRLLVPVVAMLTEQERDGGEQDGGGLRGEKAGGGLRGEKASEIALPTLIGRDGRRALLAFTCLDSLIRWRPDARPVPVPAADVWRAGAEEASAVVIDVAGPVPIAVDGARLKALATGEAAPPPHEDPDVITLVAEMVALEPALTGFQLLPGDSGTDITLHVRLAPGHAATEALPREAIARVAAGVMGGAGSRLRRGIAVAASAAAPLADRAAGGP